MRNRPAKAVVSCIAVGVLVGLGVAVAMRPSERELEAQMSLAQMRELAAVVAVVSAAVPSAIGRQEPKAPGSCPRQATPMANSNAAAMATTMVGVTNSVPPSE